MKLFLMQWLNFDLSLFNFLIDKVYYITILEMKNKIYSI